jgi:hypothetical protein
LSQVVAKLSDSLDGFDGRVAGKPVDCIDMQRIDGTEIVDGTAIVYRDGSRIYVNRPAMGRQSLRDDDILLTHTWSSQLCNIDTVRLLDRVSRFEHGFVGLGKFVPYTKPPAELVCCSRRPCGPGGRIGARKGAQFLRR